MCSSDINVVAYLTRSWKTEKPLEVTSGNDSLPLLMNAISYGA
jgi:hypothetical protein